MKIAVVAFGKLKTIGLRSTADHYVKGIRAWADIDEFELKAENLGSEDASRVTLAQAAELERLELALERRIPRPADLWLLDPTGKSWSTRQWSQFLSERRDESRTTVFCVGGTNGFSEDFSRVARGSLSLGPQTLSHDLARVVLFEQIFRALSINVGHPYHRE